MVNAWNDAVPLSLKSSFSATAVSCEGGGWCERFYSSQGVEIDDDNLIPGREKH